MGVTDCSLTSPARYGRCTKRCVRLADMYAHLICKFSTIIEPFLTPRTRLYWLRDGPAESQAC